MSPKLPLNGCIYILTTGTVLNTNVFQINLGKLLFRATLKVRLGSCLSLLSKWTTWTAPKLMHNHSLSMGGAHSRVEACIASPHLSPLCQYTTHSSVPHTATVDISWVQHCSTNGELCSLVKGHAAEHSKNLTTVSN